ncbi:hypothetical protein SLEP1_g42163 [Rubroshorea leprosula]|uniref:Uncharacterized protein n=1 Tax=Rubroshorea leprosula TaxID=152421 RepID=A0AAV5L9B0_9ROSI|nr:hypothetical protein SLEP1_g42163 [Rubroshorea leprosula]
MAERAVKLRCQRIGCFATFTENDNPEGSCTYHESVCPPLIPSLTPNPNAQNFDFL